MNSPTQNTENSPAENSSLLFKQYKLAIDQGWQQRKIEPALISVFLIMNGMLATGFIKLITNEICQIKVFAFLFSLSGIAIAWIWIQVWKRHSNYITLRDMIARDIEKRILNIHPELLDMMHIEKEYFFDKNKFDINKKGIIFETSKEFLKFNNDTSSRKLYGYLPILLFLFWGVLSYLGLHYLTVDSC